MSSGPLKQLLDCILSFDDLGLSSLLDTITSRQLQGSPGAPGLGLPGLQGSDQIINEKDKFGSTALHWCARSNNPAATQAILRLQTVDVNVKDKFGHTAVMVAAKSCHKEVLELLLEDARVDLKIKENGGLGLEKVVGIEAGTPEQVVEIVKIIKDEQEKRKGDQNESTDEEPILNVIPAMNSNMEDELIDILKETTDEMIRIQEEIKLARNEQGEIILKKNKQISSIQEKEIKIEDLAIASTENIIKLRIEKEELKKRLEEIENELENALESHSQLDEQLSKCKTKKSKLMSYFNHQSSGIDAKISIFEKNYRSLAKMLNKCLLLKSNHSK